MSRQFNSPKEMIRRVFFLLYILLFMAFGVEIVVMIARHGIIDIILTAAAFSATILVRCIGYRWLDFDRLFNSFPTGCVLDVIPESVRNEVENLVYEFHAAGADWVRRTEIRHRLVELEEYQPEIIEAYSEELSRVLAT